MTDARSCPFCTIAEGDASADPTVVYQDERWLVRSISPTPAVAGWLLLQSRRHLPDVTELDTEEAASFGPLLQKTSATVREVTGAVRIYLGSLNEGTPHFHTHILPRLPEMPNGALGWHAFGLSGLAARGEVRADPAEVERVLSAIRAKL